ncbi:hypothetical protein [Sphingomonas sp. UYP23]
MNTHFSHPALFAALPFLGAGAPLHAALGSAAVPLAGTMITATPGL